MRLVNETPYPCALFRSSFEDDDIMFNSLLARIRYRFSPDGSELERIDESADQPDIRRERVEDEYGVLETDDFPVRTGTDLIVLGDACSSRGPVTQLEFKVKAGPYDQTLLIIGDRFWERHLGVGPLRPTEPDAFESMPLIYANAFGGKCRHEEFGDIVCNNNPDGKGYYIGEDHAVGGPLPNIEPPQNLIAKWDDRPAPIGVGPYPVQWGLRISQILEVDQESNRIELKPEQGLFNRAHPDFSGKTIYAGDEVHIHGSGVASPLRFTVPPCPLQAEVRLGERTVTCAFNIEEILIDLRTHTVDISHRKLFHYTFVKHQIRRTTLRYQQD